MSGWTKNEAEWKVQGHLMAQSPFAANNALMRVEFDEQWGEWVIWSKYANAPATVSRKPRQGLKAKWRIVS